jgi:ankyrin repeat protein
VLLEHGADPNLQDADGISPLMTAVTAGHNALIDTLMEFRADPALTDGDGHTAADLARARGNAEAMARLTGP